MPRKIRIEIYIPNLYNPDENGKRKHIETKKIWQIKTEIVKKYHALSTHPPVMGLWIDPRDNKEHYDECEIFEVCIKPEKNLEEKLKTWKEELKGLLEQIDVFMVYYPINKV